MDSTKRPAENGESSSVSTAMAKTTTISTIAVQSGKTRIVIALLHCGDWIHLKILEITPELTSLGNTLAEALELQKAHNEVLRQLQNKQSPVEELLRQADQLIATQRPRAEVYAAMAESLGRAWRDINSTLELRKLILDLNVQYHTKAQEFFEKNDSLEEACAASNVPAEIEAVRTFLGNIHEMRRSLLESLMGALQIGNTLLSKLKELGAEGTLDSRPDRIRSSVNKAISQVQGWLDDLHVKRQVLETMFNRRKIQLEQCLALALLAADLKELEEILQERRNLLSHSSQLGDSSSSAELLLHEHKKLLPEAQQLQERTLKITKATEQLLASGCFAGEQATQKAYIVLSSTSDYLSDLQHRESLLERVILFFRTAQTVLTKLEQLEIQLKTSELSKNSPKLAELHSQCAKTIEESTAAPIAEGYSIIQLAGHSGESEGVKKMVEELENMKIVLLSLCTAHREENKRISAALNNFTERHDEVYNWLVTIAEAFLQGHQDMGGDLKMAEDFLQLHYHLQSDLQTKGNEINQILLTLPPILEYLEDSQRKDVDSKVEGLHNRWMKLKGLLENRLDLARIYVKFHMEADIVNREMDALEVSLRGRDVVDEDTMRAIEEKFESLVPYYQSAKNTGLTFINESHTISEPHLDTQRARKCVESILERLSGRQLNVTKSWQTFRDQVVEKREILVKLERTMAESTKTISWVSKLNSQLYPVITTPSTNPSEIVEHLEAKLESVLPDIRSAQADVGEKIKSAEELVAKAGAADEKTLSIKAKLNELSQKLVEIASEYQILLQVLIGYFKNLEEIDKKAKKYNNQSTEVPPNPEALESILREAEVARETIIERFRFAQTECEQIEQRIRNQEPPEAAQQDAAKLQHVLQFRQSAFQNQFTERQQMLQTHKKVTEFTKETKEITKTIKEVQNQITELRTQSEESLSASKAACDNFKQFTRVTEALELRVINLKDLGENLQQECPAEASRIETQICEVESQWSDVKEEIENTKEVLDKNVSYFQLVEEANDWFREGSKLLVVIARKSTTVKQPEEAHHLLQEIKSFLQPGESKQQQRIQIISNIARDMYGSDENKYAPVIAGNKEMLESFSSISNELLQLSSNLVAAEEEKQRLLKEQEEARRAEEARRFEDERLAQERRIVEEKRLAEEARLVEEKRKADEVRLAEEQRLAEEKLKAEKAKLAEEARLAEERLAEEARLAEKKRKEQHAILLEEAKKVEAAKLEVERLKQQQLQFLEDAKKAEEQRRKLDEEERKRLEKARLEDEARRLAETKKLEEEIKKAEEVRRLEELHLKNEHDKLEAERLQLEEVKLKAEQARLEEENRFAKQRLLEEEKLKTQKAQLEADKLKAEQARLEEEERRKKQAQLDEEKRLAEEARIEQMRKAEEARLEELRKAEGAKLEELRRQEEEDRKKRLQEEKIRLEQVRLEEQKKLEEEILRKQHSVQITEIKEIHKVESFQKEKSPMIEEPQEPPIFVTPLSDAVIQEGSKLNFICQVTGHPIPKVTWFKAGVPIQHNPDYHTSFDNGLCSLTIEETFAEDSARYTCKATNESGTAETSATLTVKETEPEEQLAPPSFVRMLQPGVAREGGSFQFECRVEGNPLPTVQWFKDGECIDSSPDYCFTYNNGDAILKLEKVVVENKGDYSCKASNDLGMAQSTANLVITATELTEAPVFITPLSNVMARAGQKIKLECEVAGLPPPTLTWSHNGKPVKETREIKLQYEGNKATLVVLEAFPKDAGTYTVSAKNISGETSSTSTVSVKGRLPNETSDSELASDMEPVKPSIQLPLANTTVKEGNQIRLDCVIVGQPEPEVIWYHDGRPVKESQDFQLLFQGDRCSLVIQDALPEDAGEYKVVALNSAGEASSQCVLSVEAKEAPQESKEVPPRFVKLLSDVLAAEEDKVTFEGNVTGQPKPELKWLLNNNPITDTAHFKTSIDADGNFKLEIESVKAEDKGVYTVKASNSAGDAKCFSQLIVKSSKLSEAAKPYEEIKSAPVFKELFHDRIAFEGTPTKFECIVVGKPKPKVKWLFNGNAISGEGFLISTSGDRQVVSIPELKREHQGTITCVAENEAGKASCAASLSIQSSSEIVLPELPTSQIAIIPNESNKHIETSFSSNKEVVTKSSTTSSSKVTSSSVQSSKPHIEEHRTMTQQSQTFSQTNREEPQVYKTQKIEEYHKIGDAPPVISEKTYIYGDQADSSTIKTIDQQHQIVNKPFRITRPPKWISPIVGKIVDQEVEVVLEGVLDGQPTPKITWSKDGRDLIESDRVKVRFEHNRAWVEIKNCNVRDAGRYSCTASNEGGTAVSTADLVVKKTIFPPVFGRRLQAQVIKKNDRVIMEVEITGTPDPTVTWFKDGVPVKDALSETRIKSFGHSHTLTIDKADLKHNGRYMVKAVNAGGEAQSIADIAVYEPTPDTMVEVVKTVVFEDVKKHETLASTADKTSSTISTKQIVPAKVEVKPISSEISQSYTSKSETTSTMEKSSSQQSHTYKFEHKVPDIPLPKPVEKTPTYEKKSDYEIRHEFVPDGKEILEEKKILTEDGGIETSSISKQSSLQYFVKKIKGDAPPIVKEVPLEPVQSIKPEIYQKFSSSQSEAPKSFTETKIVESMSTAPQSQDFKSSTFTKEVTREYRTLPSTQQVFKSSTSTTQKVTPPPAKPFTQEYSSSFSSTQHSSEPTHYKAYSSEVIKEFGLTPEPPAEICYTPKDTSTQKTESIFEKMKRLSETSSPSTPQQKQTSNERKEFSEKIEKSYQTSSHQTSSSSYSHTYESSSSPAFTSQKTKHETIERPISVASSSYSTERQSYSRPLSAMSGEPSSEALQMERQWAHKFEPSSQTSWSTQSTLEKKWAPVQMKSERIQESRTFLDKTPTPLPHYVGEVTRLETTVKDQAKDAYSSSKSEHVFEQSNIRPSLKSWPSLTEYVPPPIKPYPIESLPIRPVSVQDITDEVVLEPGPPPEIGYAEPPTQRRRSYVETIEQELEQEIAREPSKVPPCAVRTIPPPLPPKKEYPQAPPVPARPIRFVETPKRPPKELPFVPFKRFPELEPFPFKPDPERPRPPKVGPPPTPSKFVKGRFTDSDYESDFEAVRIPPKWKPSLSDTEEPRYRRVRAPQLVATGRSRSQEPQPLPPSQFEHPPQFQGPPRPLVNFDEFRRKKDVSQIKKMTKHFEQVRREVSPPKIKSASSPTYVYPDKKPESPKAKKKVVIDGYMADTDEPFQQRIVKTEHISESMSKQTSHSSQKFYESISTTQKTTTPKRVKFPTKKHQTSISSAKKEFVATPIITSQTTQQYTEEHQQQTHLESFPYQPDPPRQIRAKGPPPPSPSRFIKGEFRESDYESDYEGRVPPIWGQSTDKQYRPVRPVLTPTHHQQQAGKTPTPPMEFERPPTIEGPPRPKFEPIEKITPVPKSIVRKPKAMSAAPVNEIIVATPAVPVVRSETVYIQPGTPPEIGYAPGPKKTQFYRTTTSAPYQNAIQTETSNVMHFDESTDTCKRTMSVQQTHKVIKFGDKYRKQEQISSLEPLPFTPEPERPRRVTSVPPPPTPSKFVRGEFRESDYESEVESARIKPKWRPGGSDTEDLHYRPVAAPPSTGYTSHTSQHQKVITPMEFDRGPIKTTITTVTDSTDGETRRKHFKRYSDSTEITKRSHSYEPPAKIKPGTPPEYRYVGNQRLTKESASKIASHHMDSMTKEFKSKTQQFVQDVIEDVNKKQQQKPILKAATDGDAQVYREENRAMSHGTKHVDPDTGLIYFKYDFGYEFGIILPGESKSGEIPVPKKTIIEPPKRTVDIDMPVYHETTQSGGAPTPQFRPKKFTNKWDPTSESEMSEYEGDSKRKSGLSQDPVGTQTPPSRSSTPGANRMVIQPGQPRPPIFITPLRDIAVVSGQTAKFECIVQSEPSPNIIWSKDGRIIENSKDRQIHFRNGVCRLTILPAYPEDAGTYACTATNPVGSINTTATLQVPGERRSQYLK
ncbi:uncharacterized protein [Euwallacea similis]|uniref:uncharacterized protein isoform X2 n=1 Tax=Euwallacea similis TaxID=1736056 RepID=UPI00344FE5A9